MTPKNILLIYKELFLAEGLLEMIWKMYRILKKETVLFLIVFEFIAFQ